MLTALSIRDVVLIGRLDLSFHSGLGVLTGETGAGKSILLDALGLALGRIFLPTRKPGNTTCSKAKKGCRPSTAASFRIWLKQPDRVPIPR